MTINAGQVLQVLGPPHLLQGLRDGTCPASSKRQRVTSGPWRAPQIVGNLRFGPNVVKAGAPGPLVAFKVASVVTLQYYLSRIDAQLVAIDHQLKAMQQDLLDETFGEIETARETCTDVEEVLHTLGRIGELDLQRLAHAEQRIDHAFHAQAKKIDGFCAQVDALLNHQEQLRPRRLRRAPARWLGAPPRTGAAHALCSGGPKRASTDWPWRRPPKKAPTRARLAAAKLNREHREMLRQLHKAARAFRRLHVRKRVFDDAWPLKGGPERELKAFSAATRAVREQLAFASTGSPGA